MLIQMRMNMHIKLYNMQYVVICPSQFTDMKDFPCVQYIHAISTLSLNYYFSSDYRSVPLRSQLPSYTLRSSTIANTARGNLWHNCLAFLLLYSQPYLLTYSTIGSGTLLNLVHTTLTVKIPNNLI